MKKATIHHGDAMRVLHEIPKDSVQICVTSPPYFGVVEFGNGPGEIGLEESSEDYLLRLTGVFHLVRRALSKDGVLWLNVGDTYNTYGGTAGPGSTIKFLNRSKFAPRPRYSGLKDRSRKCKDLLGIPWRLALALQEDGWYLRSEIIWHKVSPAPEPGAKDRPYRSHEHVFLLTKSERGARSAPQHESRWTVWGGMSNASRCPDHPADFPLSLPMRCIAASQPGPGITVLDPFAGSGTTLMAANALGCDAIGIEVLGDYVEVARARLTEDAPLLTEVEVKSWYSADRQISEANS